MLPADEARAFLQRLAPDPDTIARAKVRVAWQAVCALPYYETTNPAMMRLARRAFARLAEEE